MTDKIAYKVLTADEWAALNAGSFEGAPIDKADGFIHLSTASQLTETVDRHFSARKASSSPPSISRHSAMGFVGNPPGTGSYFLMYTGTSYLNLSSLGAHLSGSQTARCGCQQRTSNGRSLSCKGGCTASSYLMATERFCLE